MKKFKKLKKHRWFIWAIVFIVVSLTSLVLYIERYAHDDIIENVNITPQKKAEAVVIKPEDFVNTQWVPADGYDALITFSSTTKNDSAHKHYDYQYASDSRLGEIGYWAVEDGNIILYGTKVSTYASTIIKISRKEGRVFFYYRDFPEPVEFSQVLPVNTSNATIIEAI